MYSRRSRSPHSSRHLYFISVPKTCKTVSHNVHANPKGKGIRIFWVSIDSPYANCEAFRFAVGGSFWEVMANNVAVLTDSCVKEDEVNVEKVRAEKAAAENVLHAGGSADEKQKSQARS